MAKKKQPKEEKVPVKGIQVAGGESQIATGEHGRNINTDKYLENPEFKQTGEVVFGTKITYESVPPPQTESEKLRSACPTAVNAHR